MSQKHSVTSDIMSAVFLKRSVFGDVALCRQSSSSRHFKGMWWHYLQDQAIKAFLNCLNLKMRTPWSFQTQERLSWWH